MRKDNLPDPNEPSLMRIISVIFTLISSSLLIVLIGSHLNRPEASLAFVFVIPMLLLAFTKDGIRVWGMIVVTTTNYIAIYVALYSTDSNIGVVWGMLGLIIQMAAIRAAYLKPSTAWMFYPVFILSTINVFTAIFIQTTGTAGLLWLPSLSGIIWLLIEWMRIDMADDYPDWVNHL